MPKYFNLVNNGMQGVDMRSNPLFLPDSKLHSAVNMTFDEGIVRTRSGFRYQALGSKGRFQGGAVYSPSRGLSHLPFGDPVAALVYAVDSEFKYNIFNCGELSDSITICGAEVTCADEVNLYQAENYLIMQSPKMNTLWWEGAGCYVQSVGMGATPKMVEDMECQIREVNVQYPIHKGECCFNTADYCKLEAIPKDEYPYSSHDSFDTAKHRNFLANSAGLGIYVHGRIHQQGENVIFVSDLIHKRGHLKTDDILLMEEQALESYGSALSTNSKLGQLRALQVLPAMNSANGEGDLIAYYDNGVVAYDTFQAPRETRADAEGTTIQEGWDEKRLVSHMLNHISAVGRYAVAVMPREHAFRSKYGLHFLRSVLGSEAVDDETVNTFSHAVDAILKADNPDMLKGAAVGHWVEGSRVFATVGLHESFAHGVMPMGKGLVSWKQDSSKTVEGTPRAAWEGAWVFDEDMAGIHQFLHISEPSSYDEFGFIASLEDTSLYFAQPDPALECDSRDGDSIDINWAFETRQETAEGRSSTQTSGALSTVNTLNTGLLSGVFSTESKSIKVYVRTDRKLDWELWAKRDFEESGKVFRNVNLGKPPVDYGSASWYQLRVEGVGFAEIRQLQLEISDGVKEIGRGDLAIPLTTEATDYLTPKI